MSVVRPPSAGANSLQIDYLHAIWETQKALLVAGSGATVGQRLQVTITEETTVLTNAALVGVALNKISYILRGTAVANVGTDAPTIGTLQFNSGAGTLTANAVEPFAPTEKVTIIILA